MIDGVVQVNNLLIYCLLKLSNTEGFEMSNYNSRCLFFLSVFASGVMMYTHLGLLFLLEALITFHYVMSPFISRSFPCFEECFAPTECGHSGLIFISASRAYFLHLFTTNIEILCILSTFLVDNI